jgi:predicted kinase
VNAAAPLRYRRATNGVHAVVLDGGVLAWDERSGTLHRLNESAAFVWQECARPVATDDVIAAARARDVSADELPADIERCLLELTAAGLLEIAN